ncbi:hypothetical protein [Mycobacterium sp.]|uniref:hypothetical protein n=1 Tax=Mycobacterium sp. TaxID=1785 RepID=UPI0026098A67|nr:hypothetical protein [Mycobacterium sp.]
MIAKGEGRGPLDRASIQSATPEGGTIAAYELKADPVALHLGSNDMFNAVGEAAVDFVSHEDGLAEAAAGWIGSSQLALAELAARWEVRHDHHKVQVDGLGSHVAEAMFRYVTNEEESAQAFGRCGSRGNGWGR